ncbi:MAG: DUF4363 family protein [Clostridia bacterium]|nr:DUF4363 family protein [Clostridia bacterium]
MTKKLIAIFCFIALIISMGVFESNYIITSFDSLSAELVVIERTLASTPESIDTEENISTLKNLHHRWQHRTKILKFFVWHTGIKDVEVGLSRITSYTERNNYEEAYTELNNLIDYCNHYSEDYRFSIQNVI